MITVRSEYLALAFQVASVLCFCYAIWPLTKSGLRLNPVVLGAGLLFAASWLPGSSPVPSPSPAPAPKPPPAGALAESVRQTFSGTQAEAQVLSALHNQMGQVLEYDGQRAKPTVTTVSQMGQVFAELQRFRAGNESPWGERFPALKQAIASEATARGVIGGSGAFDPAKRAAAVGLYRELGNIFASL